MSFSFTNKGPLKLTTLKNTILNQGRPQAIPQRPVYP